jgi:hypothetical protein
MSQSTITSSFEASKLLLEDIVIVQASIDNPKAVPTITAEQQLDLAINLEPAFNGEAKKIRIILKCDITLKNYPELKGSFEVAFYFYVENYDDLIKIEEEKQLLDIDENLLSAIGNITYSTSRGIIFSRCLGTVFANKVIIPIISNKAIIEAMTSIEK